MWLIKSCANYLLISYTTRCDGQHLIQIWFPNICQIILTGERMSVASSLNRDVTLVVVNKLMA